MRDDDPNQNTWDTTALRLFLAAEIERARLCQLPLALALIEPEPAVSLEMVLGQALEQKRSFDHASVHAEVRVALVLSVTPLAAGERMVGAILRRIRQLSEGGAICSAGLVGYGGCADLSPEQLLTRAEEALAAARSLGGNRLEVAPSADLELASRETLVHASEKHFLFTGKRMPEK